MTTAAVLIAMFLGVWFLGVCVGIRFGRRQCEFHLTFNPDKRGVTGPHCLRGKFYYLVPESLWVKKLCACVRDELAREAPSIEGN